MDPVIVSSNWIKTNRYVFNADGRGGRVMHIDEEATQVELAELVLDDYGLKDSTHHIRLTYMFSNKALKTMVHNTIPFYVSNTRQLKSFLSLWKIEQYVFVWRLREKDSEICRIY